MSLSRSKYYIVLHRGNVLYYDLDFCTAQDSHRPMRQQSYCIRYSVCILCDVTSCPASHNMYAHVYACTQGSTPLRAAVICIHLLGGAVACSIHIIICISKALGGAHAPYAENVPGYKESTAQRHSNQRTPCFSASEKVDRINALSARVANNGVSRSHATPSLERMRRYSAPALNPQTSVPNAPTTTSQPW